MPRILVFTPTYDGLLQDETVASIEAMQFADFDWIVSEENQYPGRDVRNCVHQFRKGRELALSGGYDGLLTVEHDMIVPPDACVLLWTTDAPVVYGTYQFRHGMGVVNLFQKLPVPAMGQSLSHYPDELRAARAAGQVEVSGCGFGCTLIRRDVLEKIPFRDTGSAPDLPFAQDCVAAGIRQVGRLDVVCGHIDTDRRVTLWPFGGLSVETQVQALQNVTINDNGRGVVMLAGQQYTVGLNAAIEHGRAGYVRVLDEMSTAAQERDDLTAIHGVGPKLAAALAFVGVDSFQALADADADELAGALDVNVSRVRKWQADVIGFLS